MLSPSERELTAAELLAPREEQRIVPGLGRMRRALAALAHPERTLKAVTVLGTNGKGSTAALLASILKAHGKLVGLYTSPHLLRVEERIVVDGEMITPGRLADLVRALQRFPELSYFETLTVAAVQELAERRVDVAVLEAGLGGRWDAVNAVPPVLSLLTNVGTDHQAWLGSGREAIAAEKAAALRGVFGIAGALDDGVEKVIRQQAPAPVSLAAEWAWVGPRGPDSRVPFSIGELTGEAELPLGGEHQLDNLRLALAGAAALVRCGVIASLDAAAVATGIAATRWPGRFQWVERRGRKLLLDGAHNREAMQALVAALDASGLAGRIHVLFSCLDDKPLAAMAAMLAPRAASVRVAPISSPRATPLGTLAAAFPGCTEFASVAAAVAALPQGEPALVTGSLRLVGEVLALEEEEHA